MTHLSILSKNLVEHCVSSLLARHSIEQLGLLGSVWVLGGNADDSNVQGEHSGSNDDQDERVSKAGPSFTRPLALFPD